MNNAEMAATRFGEGYNCAQAVFTAYAEECGLDTDTALKIAAAFGGGIGRTGETCGAVTGALMALGLMHAQAIAGKESKEAMHALAQEFMARFKLRHNSLHCRELLGCDISTAEGRQQANESGVFKSVCPRLVREAAEIVGEIKSGQ